MNLPYLLPALPAALAVKRAKDPALTYPEGFDACRAAVRTEEKRYPSKYGSNAVDVTLPLGDARIPLVLWVHGGSFVAGDKRNMSAFCTWLAHKGYAVASMNYQTAPRAPYPATLFQIGECIQYLRETLPARVNTDRLYLGGDSAGGHKAAQYAALYANEAFSKGVGIPRERCYPLSGVLLCCGAFELPFPKSGNARLDKFGESIFRCYVGGGRFSRPPLVDALRISTIVTPGYPPTFITDGNTGSFEPQARALAQKLRSLKVPCETLFFPKEQCEVRHGYIVNYDKPEALIAGERMLRFLQAREEST